MSTANNKKRNSRTRTTQLTDVMDFPSDPKALKEELKKRVIIDKTSFSTVPKSDPPIKFARLTIGIKNSDGSEGEIVIDTDRCFCFGVSEAKDPNTQALNGYSMAISMYDRDGATEKQLRTVLFINTLSDILKEYLLTDECKNETEFYELEAADLKKFNPLYLKKEKGKVIEGSAPTLYPKLAYIKPGKDKNGKDREAKIITDLYLEDEVDENGEQAKANPLDFINVRFYTTSAIKFESIFMSAKTINIQVKVSEAEVKVAETGPKRLLRSSGPRTQTMSITGTNNPLLKVSSISSSVIEEEVPEEIKEVFIPKKDNNEKQLSVSDDENDGVEKTKKKRVVKKVQKPTKTE